MSDLIIQRNTLEGIASAIREKTGSTEGILVKDLAIEIKDLEVTGEQTRPEISVGEDGLITATAGKKTSTYQMAFQPAITIIPSNTEQIAVSSGYYTGGDIVVAGVDLSTNEDAFVTRSISGVYVNDRVENIGSYAFYFLTNLTSVSFPACTNIGAHAFQNCGNLTSISFPACTSISYYAFSSCSNLTTASFPVCTYIGASTFYYCSNLTSVSFPACTYIGASAFQNCGNLTSISLPVCANIGSHAFHGCSNLTAVSFSVYIDIRSYAFQYCYKLSSLILGASTVCTLAGSLAFSSTPYKGYSTYFSGTPYIYVPSSLIDAYKSASPWSYFSSYFSAIEDMPT